VIPIRHYAEWTLMSALTLRNVNLYRESNPAIWPVAVPTELHQDFKQYVMNVEELPCFNLIYDAKNFPGENSQNQG
jgi:hypothetical protein